MARSYMHLLGSVSPSAHLGVRAADIVAALAPPARDGAAPGALVKKPEDKRESVGAVATSLIPGAVGAGAGALLFRGSHPWLGGLAGFALASTAHPLITGRGRKRALYQLGVEGSGIAGALAWKAHPFWGWALGIAAGAGVTALFKDSPAREMYDRWRSGG